MNFKNILSAAAAVFVFGATPAFASWQVDNSQSDFHFVTTKAGKPGSTAIEEVQAFKEVKGKVEDDGNIEFSVNLASVDTNIPLRDQRIKDMLFNVVANPRATFSGKVNTADLKKISTGGVHDIELAGQLTLCGQTKPVNAKLRVVSLGGNGILVSTRAPLIVSAGDFGIQAGVDAMREVMGLNVLSSSVPVSFSVVFKPAK